MDYPGENLLIKMWETLTDKGIGGLLKPWQIRREGKALADVRRDEMLMLAQAESDAEDIKLGRKVLDERGHLLPASGHDVVVSDDQEATRRLVAQTVERTVVADALRREINVGRAILMAEEVLEGEESSPPPEEPDADWLFRWRDAAGGVSEPELQRLWASLLAGEVTRPGSFSLRTVEFVRNLSKKEAERIAKLAPFAVKGMIYSGADEILKEAGIDLGFLLEIQNLGILSGVGGMGLTVTLDSSNETAFEAVLRSHGKALIVRNTDPNANLSLGVYPLTELGTEVVRLAHFEAHVPYLQRLGETLVKQGFTVTLGDAVPTGPQTIQFLNPVEIGLPDTETKEASREEGVTSGAEGDGV